MKKLLVTMSLICLLILNNDLLFSYTFNNRPANPDEATIFYTITLIGPKENNDLLYEDSNIKVIFKINLITIMMYITNKTNKSISFDFDSTAFVNINGDSYKILGNAACYEDKDKKQPICVIAPHSKYEGLVRPLYAYWYVAPIGRYSINEIFPDPEGKVQGFSPIDYKGKTVSIFLPMKIRGVEEEYTFTFKITDVKIIEK
jgi:hypothetical protein